MRERRGDQVVSPSTQQRRLRPTKPDAKKGATADERRTTRRRGVDEDEGIGRSKKYSIERARIRSDIAARVTATTARTLGSGRFERDMVLYEAMILVSSRAPKSACADVLRRLGTSVMEKGGVVTNVTSYGARTLAYEFKKPGERHFEVGLRIEWNRNASEKAKARRIILQNTVWVCVSV